MCVSLVAHEIHKYHYSSPTEREFIDMSFKHFGMEKVAFGSFRYCTVGALSVCT